MKSQQLLFSRPRKSIAIITLFLASSMAFALTPLPANNQQQDLLSQPPEPVFSLPPPSAPVDSETAKEMEALQNELVILKLKEAKAKLQESIDKTNTSGNSGKKPESPTQPEETTATFSISSIYGVGGTYQAVINYRGAELTVRQGTEIADKWKVVFINASTVRIRNGKKEKTLSLSGSSPVAAPSPSMQNGVPGAMPPMPMSFQPLGGPQ
jgi:type IV pilus biogenesis protein PilP